MPNTFTTSGLSLPEGFFLIDNIKAADLLLTPLPVTPFNQNHLKASLKHFYRAIQAA